MEYCQILFLPILPLTLVTIKQISNLRLIAQQRDSRYAIYRAVGEWLNHNTPDDATVGVIEVGIIGYYAERKMIDFAGLLQSETSQLLAGFASYEEVAGWAIERYRPDYVALSTAFPLVQTGSFFTQSCKPVERFPGSSYGHDETLVIYGCLP